MVHLKYGTTAPAIKPSAVGQHYVDTVSKLHYLSVGTSSVDDWIEVGSGSISNMSEIKAAVINSILTDGTDVLVGEDGNVIYED